MGEYQVFSVAARLECLSSMDEVVTVSTEPAEIRDRIILSILVDVMDDEHPNIGVFAVVTDWDAFFDGSPLRGGVWYGAARHWGWQEPLVWSMNHQDQLADDVMVRLPDLLLGLR